MWITYDFECANCGEVYEDIVDRPHEVDEFTPESECPHCEHINTQPLLSAPGLATYSLMSREMQTHHLRERSRKHSEKLNKSNSDEIRAKMNNGRGAKIG